MVASLAHRQKLPPAGLLPQHDEPTSGPNLEVPDGLVRIEIYPDQPDALFRQLGGRPSPFEHGERNYETSSGCRIYGREIGEMPVSARG